MKRRTLALVPFALAGGPLLAADERWPTRPVRIVMPYAAGGGADGSVRKLADKLGTILGQSVIVDNRPGAGGVLGSQVVAQAAPDGYTFLYATSSLLAQKAINPQLNIEPLTRYEHVVRALTAPAVLAVSAQSPYQTVQDLVNAARKQPGKFNYASGGVGTPSHLAGAALVAQQKLQVTHVPYRGSVDIPQALLSGDALFGCPVPSTALPLVRGGKLRILAVTGASRLKELPQVPTLKEAFNSDALVLEAWGGLWAPARTPKAVVDRLSQAVKKALTDKDLIAFFEANATLVAPTKTPEEFTRYLQREMVKYIKLVAAAGITGN